MDVEIFSKDKPSAINPFTNTVSKKLAVKYTEWSDASCCSVRAPGMVLPAVLLEPGLMLPAILLEPGLMLPANLIKPG